MTGTTSSQPSDDPNLECLRGAKLVEDGKLNEAAELFRKLAEREDLADGLRAIMAVNLATVYDKMGHVDTAVQTYEYAVGITVRMYVWAQEARAAYLSGKGRQDDAIAVCEHLLSLPFMPADSQQRVRRNLDQMLRPTDGAA